jgi:hypothetical protein
MKQFFVDELLITIILDREGKTVTVYNKGFVASHKMAYFQFGETIRKLQFLQNLIAPAPAPIDDPDFYTTLE